ncbi:hypothetical protein PMI41_03708 [Phyllobacterium sp. YR531]|nr:hypothetical protein PMI41_03708 [Phyllobacterium sp. YR531]
MRRVDGLHTDIGAAALLAKASRNQPTFLMVSPPELVEGRTTHNTNAIRANLPSPVAWHALIRQP